MLKTVVMALVWASSITLIASSGFVRTHAQPVYSAVARTDDNDDDADDKPTVTAGLGNGASAADSITILVEVVQELVNETPDDPPGANGSAPSGNSSPGHASDPMSGLGQVQPDEYCGWSTLPTPLDPNDPAWEGHTASEGSVKWKSCAILGPDTPGGPGNLEGRPVVLQFIPNAVLATAPPPPDPEVIAQRAIRQLRVPAPQVNAGPDRNRLAVNLWTWLWTDNPGALTATAAAGGVSVTATATLESVTWSLGEPAATGGSYADGPPVTITCQGTGSATPPNYDWKAEPPCGHKYTWMSTKERTGGTGRWPISATSNWNVTWQSNTGVSGTATLSATGNDALEIGEYRIVLVQGPGG